MRFANGTTSAAQLPVSVPLTDSDGSGTDSGGAPFSPAAIAPMLPPPTTPRGQPVNWEGNINSVAVHPQSTPTEGTAAQPFGNFLHEVNEGPAFLHHVSMRCGFPVVSVAVLGLAGYLLGKAAQASPPTLGAYAGALAGYLFRPLD